MVGRKPSAEEAVRLNVAVNELAKWGGTHQHAYDRLRGFRDEGRVTSPAEAASPGSTDPELATDLKQMQGEWTTKAGPMTLTMTIQDNQADVEFSDGGNVQRDNAKFVLGRSGAAKLLTRYRIGEDPSRGDALIYANLRRNDDAGGGHADRRAKPVNSQDARVESKRTVSRRASGLSRVPLRGGRFCGIGQTGFLRQQRHDDQHGEPQRDRHDARLAERDERAVGGQAVDVFVTCRR